MKEKRNLLTGIGLISAFVLWTVLIQCVDVQAVGQNGTKIGYGILDEFQGQGYATEAVKLALKWAFNHPEVVAVEAESDPDNTASQRVLEKCGFLATGAIGEEGPRFIVYKGANRPGDGAGCPADIRSARTETECRCSAPTKVERRNNKQ